MKSSIFTSKYGSDLPPVLVELAHKKVDECYEKARSVLKRDFERCKLEFGLTGKCAGKAYPHKNLIRLHSEFLARNLKDMLEDTIPHEIAHLLTRKLYGSLRTRLVQGRPVRERVLPHGKEWQAIMLAVFGLTPTRCHNYAMTIESAENAHGYVRVPANKYTGRRL